MTRWIDMLGEESRRKLRKGSKPRSLRPMLATLTKDRFSDPGWIYERKLDGERCLAYRDGRGARLMSRNGERINDTYPEIADAIRAQACDDFVVDGEIVAFSHGRTSFERLQGRIGKTTPEEASRSGVRVWFYLFDVVHIDGYDTTRVPLRDRKGILRRAIEFDGSLRFTPHRNEDGEGFFRDACRKRWEGIMAKDASSAYTSGRSRAWLKFKCVNRQEFVIGGFTEPEGTRTRFGALLLGYYDGDELRYAGKVGTGFDERALERIGSMVSGHERKTPPFASCPDVTSAGDVHWTTPRIVAEIAFTEWTEDGRLRHPRFVGLRRDKDPHRVVRERAGGR